MERLACLIIAATVALFVGAELLAPIGDSLAIAESTLASAR